MFELIEVKPILHLKTQDGQPYGSVRKCCEECGVMILGDSLPEGEHWTDDRELYTEGEYRLCRNVRDEE